MGKDLKGKELGVGISQRADGIYTGRFTTRCGKRKQKYFRKLQECRAWMAEARFEDEHGNVFFSDAPAVDVWFRYWLDEVKGDSIRITSRQRYETAWGNHVSAVIGNMELKDVKPIHCQKILNDLNENHRVSTIKFTRTLMVSVFECAVENELIQQNPRRSAKVTGGEQAEKRVALTIEEQRLFLTEAQKSTYYNGFALVLQTGLRVGELIALQWSDVDFRNRKLHVRRSAAEVKGEGFLFGNPKAESGTREIPLTEEAIRILRQQKEWNSQQKVSNIQYAEYVFINSNGTLIQKAAYNRGIYTVCDRAGIRRFSIHLLRHTFATRCIESGMQPKTLQTILEHSKIEITMNLYVHVTEDHKTREMEMIEQKLRLV